MSFSRRHFLRTGALHLAGVGIGLSRVARVRADSLPSGPTTSPFVWELVPGRGLPYAAKPVPAFATKADPANVVNVDGSSPFHVSDPRIVPANTEYYLIYEKPVAHRFHPQLPVNVLWGYDGQIPGPTFVAQSGIPQLVRFVNFLPENDPVGIGLPISAIHRHGGFQAPEDDGYPLDIFSSQQSRDYYYPNVPAGGLLENEHSTMWYHDHTIDITAQNVYRGLAGFFLGFNSLDTGREWDPPPALGLPSGECDIGLVIQDRLFDRNGYLIYDNFEHDGFLGNKFLVNGLIQPYLRVARRKYRFRILNGSNARFYDLVLSNGESFMVIGTDSTLMEHPVEVKDIMLGSGQRTEVVLDFARFPLGTKLYLVNRMEQTDPRKAGDIVSPGTPLLQFWVDRNPAQPDQSRMPSDLSVVKQGPNVLLPQVKIQRTFKFERSRGAWMINGEFFDENRINADPKRGEPEIWHFESGGGWDHPVHPHLHDMFVLARKDGPVPVLEQGRRDLVNVGSSFGDATVLVKFDNYLGRYVMHCHNIEHEDMRMMAQFEIQP